ncbi:MAG: hypothetical protein IPM39_25910 [Chloroflexi bacterium]|nr:hypothetical protein [Chloroflexota bacterium]
MFDIIGEFDVTSGKLRISDPCYDVDTWCAGEVEAANGRWAASVERTDEGIWGTRIARLLVTHVDCPVPAGCWLATSWYRSQGRRWWAGRGV